MPAPLSVMQRLGQPMPSGSPMQQLGGTPASLSGWLNRPGINELLLGLGAGILEETGRGGRGLGAGIARGALLGTQLGNQAQRSAAYEKRQEQYDQQYQRQVEEQDRQRKQQELKQAQVDQYISTLPPEQQQLARLDPDKFVGQSISNTLPDPNKPPMTRTLPMGNEEVVQEYRPGQGYVEISRAPRFAPQQPREAKDSYRVLTGEEAAKYGLAPGTVASMGTNGKIDILQKPPGQESDNEPLVEVYDPNSPTGTSFKRRSEAPGLPGKPPSGGLAITGYDDQGRPLIQMGGTAKEKPLPADVVGRASSVAGGVEDIKAVKDYVLPNGEPDRTNIGLLNPPIPYVGAIPGTAATAAEAQIGNAIDNLMRLRTGAGMNVLERSDYLDRYTPRVTDPKATIETRMNMLQRDLEEAKAGFEAAQNKGAQPAQQPKPSAAPDKPAVMVKSEAEYNQLPAGTMYVGPDGKTRMKQ